MTDLSEYHWYVAVFRSIFAMLDKIIYDLLAGVFNIFYMVAGAELRTGEVVTQFFGRIQLIFGIIIVFKLVISLFTGIIDPDSISDQKKGVGSIIKRIVVVLFMFTLIIPLNIPIENENNSSDKNSMMTWNERMNQSGILFGTMYELQSRILNGNVIQNIILGNMETDDRNNAYSSSGDIISTYLLQSFVLVNLQEGEEDYTKSENWMCHGHIEGEEKLEKWINLAYSTYSYSSETQVDYEMIRSYLLNNINMNCKGAGEKEIKVKWYYTLIPFLAVWDNVVSPTLGFSGERYFFVYHLLLSSIVGVLFIIMIISLTIDVAVRVFKLVLLRLISPVAILSYVDPKSEKTFNNWVKAVSTTYLDLFVRIAVISFIMLFIRILPSVDFDIPGSSLIKLFAHIALDFGLLFFAKEAPKFITETLGIDSKGGMGLFSGFGKLRAATSAVGGIASGAISSASATRANGGNVGRSILSGIGGAVGGGINSGREFFREGSDTNSIRQANQRHIQQNYERANSGSTVHGRALSRLERGLGLRTRAQRYEDEIKELRESNAAWNRLDSALNSDDSKLKVTNKIKDARGRSLFTSRLGYSLDGINSIIKTMENSGQYSNEDIEAVKRQRDGFRAQYGAIGIKDSDGNIIRTIATFENGYSVKDINDVLKDMEHSGQYSAEELMNVRQQLKAAQKQRFGEIAIEGDSGVKLGGTAGQVYQAANTIMDIGTRYSDQVKGFNAFANVQGATLSQALGNGTLIMARDFKGGTFDAVRDADAREASREYRNAHEDDAFSSQNNNSK